MIETLRLHKCLSPRSNEISDFFIAMLRNTTQYEIDKASIKNYLVSSALYNMIALIDEKIKIGNCSPSMNIILARLYKLNGNIFLPVICRDL